MRKNITISSVLQESRRVNPWAIYILLIVLIILSLQYDIFYSIGLLTPQEKLENADFIASDISQAYNLSRRIGFSCLGALGLFLTIAHRNSHFRVNGLLGWLSLTFLVWSVLSVTWADDTFLAIRRIVVLLFLVIAALGVAAQLSFRELVVFALVSGLITLGVGAICEIGLGTFHPFKPDYRFGGLTHPIGQAINSGMLAAAALTLARFSRNRRLVYWGVALVALIFIVLSKSRGPMVGTILALIVFHGLASPKPRFLPFLIVGPIVAILLYFIFDDSLLAFSYREILLIGREDQSDQTLTGRIPLWGECVRYILQSPIFGYGYDSFWTPGRFMRVAGVTDFTVADVHNGYLDLLLGLGIPGASMGISVLFLTAKKSLTMYRTTRDASYVFCFTMLLMLVINMFLVKLFLTSQFLSFVCMVIVIKLAFFSAKPPEIATRVAAAIPGQSSISYIHAKKARANLP